MHRKVGAFLAATVLVVGGVAASVALAGEGRGHDPVTICHKPGTPAQQTLVVDDDSTQLEGHLGHGDTIGPCADLPVDVCPNLEGNQSEVPEGYVLGEDEDGRPACVEEEGPPPTQPVDVCPNLEGDQATAPEGYHVVEDENGRTACVQDEEPPVTTTTETTPTTPAPTHDCTFVGADKDGGHDAYGGTNDDCAPFPPANTTTATPPAGPGTLSTTTPSAPATTTTTPPVTEDTTPTPDEPVVITKTKDSTGKPIIVKKNTKTGAIEIKRPGGKYQPAAAGSG